MDRFKEYGDFKANLTKEQLADFNANKRFIEVAMYMELIREADLNFRAYLDNLGHAEFYERAMEIVDDILYTNNSEFLKYWKLYINGLKVKSDYFHILYNTCMDWYFMDLAVAELKVRLKGYETEKKKKKDLHKSN